MAIFKWGVLLVALLGGAIALGAGIATAHDSGTEVRITAMRLDDGRIEFALQEREGEGWGERILPSGRFFPTTSVGRWLNSTPITVGVVEGMSESAATPTPTATATPTSSPTPPAATPSATPDVATYWFARTSTDAITDERIDLILSRSTAVASKTWSYSSLDDPAIVLRCRGDTLEAWVDWDTFLAGRYSDDTVGIVYRIDSASPRSQRWGESTSNTSTFASQPRSFIGDLLTGSRLTVRAVDYSGETYTVQFHISGLSQVLGNLSCY